jgi:CheY-like chemotaxis protein
MRLLGLKVLLVEDDVDNLELLSSYLEGEGALPLSAGSISAALTMSAEHAIDILVSDLELADGDACTLLAKLREGGLSPQLPAIAISGYSDLKWRSKAADCGFDRYLIKPFALDHLADSIAELSRAGASNVVDVTSRHAVAGPAARALPRR